MPELTIASFNCHAGLQARRNGVCEPYDLDAALRGLDADVIVAAGVVDAPTAAPPRSGGSPTRLGAERVRAAVRAGPARSVAARASRRQRPRRRSASRSSAGIPAEAQGRLAVGTVAGDPTPERGGAARRARRRRHHGRPRRRAPHVAPAVRAADPAAAAAPRSSPPPAGPAIVAGDCNFWGPGVQSFLPGWRRTVRGRTWPARRPHSQIDHILVRAGEASRSCDARGAARRRLRPPAGAARRCGCG